jgi:hypothetical protein
VGAKTRKKMNSNGEEEEENDEEERIKIEPKAKIERLIEKILEVDDVEKFGEKEAEDYHEGYEKRKEALKPVMEELVKYGKEATPHVVKVLNNHDMWSSIFAAEMLSAIKDEASIDSLIDALEVYDDALTKTAEEALIKIGKPAVPYLIRRINDRINNPVYDEQGEKIDTISTIGTLAKIRDEEVFDFLVHLLEERNPEVVLDHLCPCFVEQKNPKAIPFLEKIVDEFSAKGRSWSGGEPESWLEFARVKIAEESIKELKAVKIARDEHLKIYGCCRVCKHYAEDKKGGYCEKKGEKKDRIDICFECEPESRLNCKNRCDSSEEGGKKCDYFENQRFYIPQTDFEIVRRTGIKPEGLSISFNYDQMFYIVVENKGFHAKVPCKNIDKLSEFRNLLTRGEDFEWGIFMKYEDALRVQEKENSAMFSFSTDDWLSMRCGDDNDLELKLSGETVEKLAAMVDFNRFAFLTGVYNDYYGKEVIEKDMREVGCEHEYEEIKRKKKYIVYRCEKCGAMEKKWLI